MTDSFLPPKGSGSFLCATEEDAKKCLELFSSLKQDLVNEIESEMKLKSNGIIKCTDPSTFNLDSYKDGLSTAIRIIRG